MKKRFAFLFVVLFLTIFLIGCDSKSESSIVQIQTTEEQTEINYNLEFHLLDDETYGVSAGNDNCLEKIIIPSTYNGKVVTKIMDEAFLNCSNLRSITIPGSVTSIGSDAFELLHDLRNIYYDGTIEDWCNIKFSNSDSTQAGCSSYFYMLDNNGDIEYNGKKYSLLTELKIPNSVTSIGNYQFSGFGYVKSVTIPDTVTNIGEGAFSYCSSLTSVIIPDTVTNIGEEAFYNCVSLTSVIIPDTVKSIGKQAFYYCASLTSVTILDGVTNIGESAFELCRRLKSITLPNSLTSIGDKAFFGCSIETATIPVIACSYINSSNLKTVVITSGTSLGYPALSNCNNLTTITIPSSLTSITKSLFYDCNSLKNVYYDGTIEDWCNIRFSNSYANPLRQASNFYMLDNSGDIEFNGKKYSLLTELTIPNGVTSIGNYQFSGGSSLKSITIPDSVRSIGNAFSDCSSITSITIPNGVTSIGNNAFYNCTNLTSIALPNRLTSIGESAFGNCNSLTSITIPNGLTKIGESTFSYCSSLKSITIPDSVTSIGGFAFGNCISLTSIVLPNRLTSIGYNAFSNCSSLTSITIPNGVTSIGNNAFNNCTNLTSIALPNSLTKIGYSTFGGCYHLVEVINKSSLEIAAGSTNYGEVAHYAKQIITDESQSKLKIYDNGFIIYDDTCLIGYNGSDTKITIPNGIEEINCLAFYNCSSITSITIPNGVTNIGEKAFSNCSSITGIEIPNGVINIGEKAFSNCSNLTSITIPEGVINIGEMAFYFCGNLTNITISSSVRSIGSDTFDLCDSLKNIYYDGTIEDWCNIKFNDSYSNPMYYAKKFYIIDANGDIEYNGKKYSLLTELIIPNGFTSIGDYAFFGCNSLTSITIPDSVINIGNAFYNCNNLTTINFNGTISEWNSIEKGNIWKYQVPSSCQVVCTDGTVSIVS